MRSWIVNIITVMMLTFFAEMLIPNGKFKRYSKLVLGLIVIITIIKPIVQISNREMWLNKITVDTSNYLDRSKVTEQSKIMKQKQIDQIVRTYYNNLTDQIEKRVQSISKEYTTKVKVNVDTDINSSGFGSIRGIEVLLSPDEHSSVVETVAPVRPLNISTHSKSTEQQDEYMNNDKDSNVNVALNKNIYTKEEEQLRLKIIDSLQTVYNVPGENIKINIQKSKK
ncbi:MAG: stage sporulation protein [Clostridiales bacterium]|nr:stage sporulation protein [Clostridiales bacterium]MDK2934499.1 stage sporulation protein [Clostridiales bacterium]